MLRLFQSTRPGGARLAVFSRGCRTINVSIHAPRRGATFYPSMSSPTFCVSIHAPRRGATFGDFPKSRNNTSFNPRAPAGRDFLIVPRQDTTYQFQSTRPGGARHSLLFHVKIPHIVSIHAPRRGATSSLSKFLATFFMFQSTRPGGARLEFLVSRTSGDDVSIHAPRRGATYGIGGIIDLFIVSIHAPRRGATVLPDWIKGQSPVSIHAPRRGATSTNAGPRWVTSSFNPRAPAGRDAPAATRPRGRSCFNPRAPAGRDLNSASPSHALVSFQSTRPGGARPGRIIVAGDLDMFQSTRPGGARHPLSMPVGIKGQVDYVREQGILFKSQRSAFV